RRIIRLDGCWLKGYCGGHLLAAIGVDANDCIYPVAFVVGLIEAISLLFPNAEAKNCARHLYNNFKNMEGFRGQVMRLTY
ncbi:hypothetical protein Gotur_007399, partial [Gossypium turneri]